MATRWWWQRAYFVRWLPLLLLCATLIFSACVAPAASRWDTAQEASSGERATDKEALAGGEFNKFFPQDSDDYDVVYTQEKSGFAEAVLKQAGKDVATLAIFDTVSNPAAAEKYRESSEKIGDYPAVEIGSNGTGILVADRFQVQVRAKSDSFTAADREEWLEAFDLDGLAELE